MNNNNPSTEPDPNQQFAIVELIPGQPPPANVIGGGPLDMLLENLSDTVARTNEIQQLNKARFDNKQIQEMQEATRAFQVQSFCDGVARLTRRMDQLEAQRAAQARADEEEEQRKIQAKLAAMPNPDDPDPFAPSGEMHQIPASDPIDEQQLEAIDAEGGTGPVPLSYGKMPLSYVKSEEGEGDLPEQLTKKVPPTTGTDPEFDPEQLAYPETPKQRAPAVFE